MTSLGFCYFFRSISLFFYSDKNQRFCKKSNQLLNPLKAQSLKSIEIVATTADLIFFHCMLDSFFSVIAWRPFFDSLKCISSIFAAFQDFDWVKKILHRVKIFAAFLAKIIFDKFFAVLKFADYYYF